MRGVGALLFRRQTHHTMLLPALAMPGGLASKLVVGLSTLAMNLAMRHVVLDVSPLQQKLLQSAGFKCVTLFAMFFIATRDLMLAAALTAVTFVLLRHLLHENSPLCILPGCVGGRRSDALVLGPAAGGPITREAYEAALAIVASVGRRHRRPPQQRAAHEAHPLDGVPREDGAGHGLAGVGVGGVVL